MSFYWKEDYAVFQDISRREKEELISQILSEQKFVSEEVFKQRIEKIEVRFWIFVIVIIFCLFFILSAFFQDDKDIKILKDIQTKCVTKMASELASRNADDARFNFEYCMDNVDSLYNYESPY